MSSTDTSSQVPQEELTLAKFLLARIAEDEETVIRGECKCWDRKLPDCPDRVLADCEAKRRIICRLTDDELDPWGPDEHADLRDFASVYADHPDYRLEWKP